MHIKKIRLSGIKCFGSEDEEVSLDLQRPDGTCAGWTVLAGGNGAGKTTLLRSLALSVVGPDNSRALQMSFAGWIQHGLQCAHVATLLSYDEEDNFSWDNGPSWPREVWAGITWKLQSSIKDGDFPFVEPRISIFKEVEQSKGGMPLIDGPWSENPRGWFIAGYGPFRRLSSQTSSTSNHKSVRGHMNRLFGLFREDAVLAEGLLWLKEIHMRALEKDKAAKELKKSVLALLDDGLLPGNYSVKSFDSYGLWVDSNGTKLLLDSLSDGYRTVTGLVLDIIRQLRDCYGTLRFKKEKGLITVDHPGVVLIDEVELHLHVSWQKKIGNWLKQRFPRVQFIVTTHSPFICQSADSRGLIRLPSSDQPGKVEHVSEEVFNAVVNGGSDDAVMSALFGVEQTHSDKSEALRDEIARLEADVLEKKAAPEQVERLEELLSKLPTSTTSSLERSLRALEKRR